MWYGSWPNIVHGVVIIRVTQFSQSSWVQLVFPLECPSYRLCSSILRLAARTVTSNVRLACPLEADGDDDGGCDDDVVVAAARLLPCAKVPRVVVVVVMENALVAIVPDTYALVP